MIRTPRQIAAIEVGSDGPLPAMHAIDFSYISLRSATRRICAPSHKQWEKKVGVICEILVKRLTATNDFESLGRTRVGATSWVNYTMGAKRSISLRNCGVYGA